MTPYTPDPWHIDGALVCDSAGRILATVPYSREQAQLMAAAPELLATLRRVRSVIDTISADGADLARDIDGLLVRIDGRKP
jgi:hypothetical protein